MKKSRFLLVAAAGLIAAKPAVATLGEIEARLDQALQSARSQHQAEQTLIVQADALDQQSAEETVIGMY
jgi:hypothetical protein